MNTSKRTTSEKPGNDKITPRKKSKVIDFSNYLHKTLRESSLTLKHPPEKCNSSQETIHLVRNIKKNLEKHFDYPRNLTEFYTNFETECDDLNVFRHYLFPNIMRTLEENEDDHVMVADSVIKILLSIPILQNKLIDFVFEKAIDLAAQSQCGGWIKMILKCISSLDTIVNRDKMSSHLINLLDISSEKLVRLEIITAIPDIIGDQEHNNISAELSRILSEDHDLIPAILECLSYLCLSDEQTNLIQKKCLNILSTLTKCNYFPNFVKFLLIPGETSESGYMEAVQGLRNCLGWPTSIAKPQDIASSQVLTATAVRHSMVASKFIASAWLKVISNCKVSTDHKAIDFIIMLILSSVSEEKQKQVENFVKKHCKLDILKEEHLDETFLKFKPILTEYLRNLTNLASSLLKTKNDPVVESFASHMYMLMFSELEDCCPTIVAELLQLALDAKQSAMSILLILNKVAKNNMSLLKPQSLQMLTLLDRVEDMRIIEVKAIMNLLCALAYSDECSVIRDDIHMIIRKQLGSSNPRIKIQGIISGLYAVKYLMASNSDDEETRELPDDISYGSVTHLAEGDLREAAQIIELISRSTRQFPDMIAFFYDELSVIIKSASHINKNYQSWLTDAVTNDLQQNFIVDSIESDRIDGLKLKMQFCLNSESEMDEVIAINIAGLTLQSKTEICVGILSPLFQVVQTLHHKQYDGNLSSIDALLGCAIVMPEFDIDLIEEMDLNNVKCILDCLIHCINWFRELLNAFAIQNDTALKSKILKRIIQVEELEKLVGQIIMRSKITYRPPVCTFSITKYMGELIENKLIKPQVSKPSKQKKPAADDSVLPETAKSQATQNNIYVKSSLELIHNIHFRQFNLSILHLFQIDVSEDNESDTELTIRALKYLLKCTYTNLEGILVAKIKKKTFLVKQDVVEYDPLKAEDCAKFVSEILPKLVDHLNFIISYIDKFTEGNNHEDGEILYTSEIMEYILCLEYIYMIFATYFKWIGFKNHHSALLRSSLRTIANTNNPTVSLKEIVIAVAEHLQTQEKYCLQLSTAVALIELLKAVQTYSDNRHVLKILRNMAQNFLSQSWKTFDGALEKGLLFNQSVDRLASIYFINNEILALKNVSLQLTHDIQVLKNRNDTLSSLKCINKGNFPILYRNLGTALYEATKSHVDKGMTNSEHLALWKDVATILKYMSDIAKTLENRNNLSAFFKKSIPVLKIFISQGIPILEIQFKNDTQEVLEILKILQQSTRFLQSLCCHSRLKKDTALMNKVPFMRQLLETLIYKVKALLAANKCSEAFWMGNLKNKDIHGEVIATQQSVESEESLEDADEQLPEDDDSGSDDEMLNPDSRSLSDIV